MAVRTDMASRPPILPSSPWQNEGLRFNAYNSHLRGKFGHRVQKGQHRRRLHLPQRRWHRRHRRLHLLRQPQFQPQPPRLPRQAFRGQIDEGIRRLKRRYDCDTFSPTSSRPPTPTRRSSGCGRCTKQALAHPQVVGLAIGTRPDCVPDDVLDLLEPSWPARDLSVRRIRHADDARSLARLDEPRASSRRDGRRHASAAADAGSRSAPT